MKNVFRFQLNLPENGTEEQTLDKGFCQLSLIINHNPYWFEKKEGRALEGVIAPWYLLIPYLARVMEVSRKEEPLVYPDQNSTIALDEQVDQLTANLPKDNCADFYKQQVANYVQFHDFAKAIPGLVLPRLRWFSVESKVNAWTDTECLEFEHLDFVRACWSTASKLAALFKDSTDENVKKVIMEWTSGPGATFSFLD